jgi:hypothetical protein
MRGVDAVADSAEMVELKVGWDRPGERLIHDAMHSTAAGLAVTFAVLRAGPEPARCRDLLVDAVPELPSLPEHNIGIAMTLPARVVLDAVAAAIMSLIATIDHAWLGMGNTLRHVAPPS